MSTLVSLEVVTRQGLPVVTLRVEPKARALASGRHRRAAAGRRPVARAVQATNRVPAAVTSAARWSFELEGAVSSGSVERREGKGGEG